MSSSKYESWNIDGMPYSYGQSFEVEYSDLDSFVKTSINSHTDRGLKINVSYLGKPNNSYFKLSNDEIVKVKHSIEEESVEEGQPYVETLSLHFQNPDSHDYFVRLIRELYRRFC